MRQSVAGHWLAMSCLVLLAACGGGGGSSDASLSFSPSKVTGNVQQGEVGTLTTSVTVQNADKITGQAWIDVEDSQHVLTDFDVSGTDSAHFSVTLHTSPALGVGHHTGTFGVHVCKDDQCTQEWIGATSVAYDVDVEPAPLAAVPTTATASTVPWKGTDSDVVGISVTGGTQWTASSGASWLVNTGSASGASPAAIGFGFAPGQLAEGDYTTAITVRDSASGQSVDIPVTLHVIAPAFVIDAGGSPVFTAINGAPIAPQPLLFELDNGVGSPWSLDSSATWLEPSATSGTTPANLMLGADPSIGALAAGGYDATLTLSSTGVASKALPAHLQLVKPTLTTSVPSVTLGGARGRDFNTTGTVQLSLNTGTNAYPVSMSALPSSMSIAPAQPVVGQAGSTLNVGIVQEQATVGSTSQAVTFTSTINGDTVTTPLTVNINLDQRRLLPSSWGVAFASSPTGTTTSRTLQVRDNFGGGLDWTASSDSAWLSASNSGNTSGTSSLVLAADPTQAPDDAVSVARVTIASATPGVSPAVVRVALWKSSTGAAAMTKLPGVRATRLVADKIRPYVYAHNGGSSITVYNAYTAAVVRTISNVGTTLGPMAVSPDGSLLYVVDTAGQALRIVDLSTLTSTSSWPLAQAPTNVASILVVRPNGVEVVLLGDGTAYTSGHALASPYIFAWGNMSATDDGSKVYTIDTGGSPASQAVWTLDYSEIAGGVLFATRVDAPFFVGSESNGADIAVTGDGSAVYTASGAPYTCVSLKPSDLTFVQYLPGGSFPYPNNVEVTRDGRVACGIASNGSADILLYAAGATYPVTYKVAGYNGSLVEAQMAVTADGFVIVAPTNDPLLAFVPIGP